MQRFLAESATWTATTAVPVLFLCHGRWDLSLFWNISALYYERVCHAPRRVWRTSTIVDLVEAPSSVRHISALHSCKVLQHFVILNTIVSLRLFYDY